MKKVSESFPNKDDLRGLVKKQIYADNNERECPSCGLLTLQGMPGGRDSTCENCGYKDPCCYD